MKKSFILLAFFIVQITHLAYALTNSVPAESTAFNAVVFLKIEAMDSDGSSVTGFCNGTLISPVIVVTAAHCLSGSLLNQNVPLQLEVGSYRYRTLPDGKTIRTGYVSDLKHSSLTQVHFATGVGFDSKPNQIPPERDFAFIILGEPIPLSPEFVFPRVWRHSLRGQTLLNPFVVTINPVEYISTSDTKQMALLNHFTYNGYSAESKSTSRVAPGDSGAPLFATINNEVYLIGVTKGRAETFFSNWDVFALWSERVPAFLFNGQ